MNYWKIITNHRWPLMYGLLLTFFSNFGQTFFISLFVPSFLRDFSISKATFAALYSGATLTSAALLPVLGARIDKVALRPYTFAIALGLLFSCALMGTANSVWLLFIGLFGLRLSGQGLLSHTASTSIARRFDTIRGKSLSITGLGYPLGEALLPITVSFLILNVGWRLSWGFLFAAVLLVLLPFSVKLAAEVHPPRPDSGAKSGANSSQKRFSQFALFKDTRFLFLCPGDLAFPFLVTGAFLFQMPFAEFRGWAPVWIGTGFIGFSMARVVISLMTGPWVDRLTGLRLFPLYLLPMGAGFLILAFWTSPWAAVSFLLLAGTTQGIASVLKTAMWAEVYGVKRLGEVRSLTSALMVMSTAISPLLVGWLLSAGFSFNHLLYLGAGAVILISFFSYGVIPKVKAEIAAEARAPNNGPQPAN